MINLFKIVNIKFRKNLFMEFDKLVVLELRIIVLIMVLFFFIGIVIVIIFLL